MESHTSCCWRLFAAWFVCVLLLLTASSAKDQFRRCRRRRSPAQGPHPILNVTVADALDAADWVPGRGGTQTISYSLQEFYNSTCRVCPKEKQTRLDNGVLEAAYNKTHTVVLLESTEMQDKAFIATAGLLSAGCPVTLITGPNMPHDHNWIMDAVLEQIPCEQQSLASLLLGLKRIVVADASVFPCPFDLLDPVKMSPGDNILCTIQNSLPIAAALSAQLKTILHPSVLIIDAASVSGLLVAERERLPAVLLVEHGSAFLRHVLGAPDCYRNERSVLSPGFWYSAFASGIQDRLNALDLTSAFVALNRIRTYLGLTRVRHVADLWRAGGNVLLVTEDSSLAWRSVLPNLFSMPEPLLPPCIPCTEVQPASVADNSLPKIVLAVPFDNDDGGRLSARRLMQGFEIVRRSIRGFLLDDDICDDKQQANSFCWNGPTDFQVVPVETNVPVVLLPDYCTAKQETEFLDSLARHQPVAIVSLCSAANTWIKSLGPPVLCLESAWEPIDIAFRLMNLWHNNQNPGRGHVKPATVDKTERTPEIDGLDWVVNLVEQLGRLQSRSGKTWRNGWEIGRQVLESLNESGFSASNSDDTDPEIPSPVGALVVFLAWLILVCAMLYIPFKDKASLQKFRLRRLHHHRSYHKLTMSAIANDFWFRLPDLDRLWNLWRSWFSDQLSRWDQTIGTAALSSKTAEVVDQNNHHHSRRRRNASKKRH